VNVFEALSWISAGGDTARAARYQLFTHCSFSLAMSERAEARGPQSREAASAAAEPWAAPRRDARPSARAGGWSELAAGGRVEVTSRDRADRHRLIPMSRESADATMKQKYARPSATK